MIHALMFTLLLPLLLTLLAVVAFLAVMQTPGLVALLALFVGYKLVKGHHV